MKSIVFVLIILCFFGCNDRSKFGFSSGDCNEVHTNCLNKCIQSGKQKAECLAGCDRSRGMCESIKIKGCLQDCNKNYGKDSPSSENCKKQCMDNKGVSY